MNSLGEFDFNIMACLVNHAFKNIVCVISPVAKFKVANPCTRTKLMTPNLVIPNDEFVMYQTGNHTLEGALTLPNFPDTESVRIEALGYPAGVCG